MITEKELKQFASRYEEQEQELLVLTSESVGSAGSWGRKGLWSPSAGLLAHINTADGQLQKDGCLSWLAEEGAAPGWGFGLRKLTIYRVRARALKEGPAAGKYFMLLEVLETLATEPQLEPVRQAYLTPVTLTDAAFPGVTFELERQFDWFNASLDWLGQECSVSLECDVDNLETAHAALANFKQLYDVLPQWDAEFRAYAAAELTENANDWQRDAVEEGQEYLPLTKADFARRISISEFNMSPDGDFTAYYDDDDMFWGHVILVEGNITADAADGGNITDAYIAG